MRGTYPASAGEIDRDFLSLAQGDRLGVEFFDFVFGGGCGRGGIGDFYFHQGFSEGFGVDYKRIACTLSLVFIFELACLRVGVDGEEVALEG